MADIQYFKLVEDVPLKLYDGYRMELKKDSIFHIQADYVSPITGERMIVIAVDKCTPVAVPYSSGNVCG